MQCDHVCDDDSGSGDSDCCVCMCTCVVVQMCPYVCLDGGEMCVCVICVVMVRWCCVCAHVCDSGSGDDDGGSCGV